MVVQGVSVNATNATKNAILEFWEDIGGMYDEVNGIHEIPHIYIERKEIGEMNEGRLDLGVHLLDEALT